MSNKKCGTEDLADLAALYEPLGEVHEDLVAQAIAHRRFPAHAKALETISASGSSRSVFREVFAQVQAGTQCLLRESRLAGRVVEVVSPEEEEAELAALKISRQSKITERDTAKRNAMDARGNRRESLWDRVDRLNEEIKEMETRIAALKLRVGSIDDDGDGALH